MSERKGFRKVHVGTDTWDYKFGKTSVTIFSPKGVRSVVDFNTLTGQNWLELDRDCKFPIGPRYVSDYILNHLFEK